jgi:hypothetical protein
MQSTSSWAPPSQANGLVAVPFMPILPLRPVGNTSRSSAGVPRRVIATALEVSDGRQRQRPILCQHHSLLHGVPPCSTRAAADTPSLFGLRREVVLSFGCGQRLRCEYRGLPGWCAAGPCRRGGKGDQEVGVGRLRPARRRKTAAGQPGSVHRVALPNSAMKP